MIKNSSDCAIVCCPLTHYCAAVSRSGPTNHSTQTFVSKQWWLGLHPLNALDIFLPCPNQCNAVVGTFQCCQDLISFSSAKSDIGVENWRNSNSWTFLSLRFTILNVTNSSLNVCIHSTHHRTMPQVEIFIVRNWKYIFRRVRERAGSEAGELRTEDPPGHVCPCRGFPLCRLPHQQSAPAAPPGVNTSHRSSSYWLIWNRTSHSCWMRPRGSQWDTWHVTMAAVTWLAGCLLLAVSVAGFSLDVDRAAVYSGDSGSLFGFSVAAHRDQQTGWWVNQSIVVIKPIK